MLLHIAICIIVSCGIFIGIRGQPMLGAGKWSVLSTQLCANDAEMPWTMRVRRHKLNRTHDAFDADLDVGDDVDDSYAVRLEICKMVDGGCKPYMTMADDSLSNFVKKHAEGNVKLLLAGAGVDPPDFPIPKGPLNVKNYVLNTEDLPKDGLYGEYEVEAFVLKEGNDVACTKVGVKYEPSDKYEGAPYG